MKFLLFFFCFFPFVYSFSTSTNIDLPIHGIKFGDSKEKLKVTVKDISNPNSWEETKFQVIELDSWNNLNPSSKEITFWNDRLCELSMSFSGNLSKQLIPIFDQEYGKKYVSDSTYYSWGKDENSIVMTVSFGDYPSTTIYWTDESQKEFHYSDLMKGVIFWIIVSILGLFVLNWIFAWLMTSFCKNCRTFNMGLTTIEHDNLKDYGTGLGKELYYDKNYMYKCKKCGNTRKDRFSGFWSYLRNKN